MKTRGTISVLFFLLSISVFGNIGKQEIVRALSFENLGFEAGKKNWMMPQNAVIDSQVKHGGSNSVRIDVTDIVKDGNYVSRLFPIVGGCTYDVECFMRTKDVTEAKGGKRSSNGAGIFVEWADAEKRYVWGGGDRNGFRGTADWQKLSVLRQKAPDHACYMKITFSLRDTGTVWFDDLKMSAVEKTIELVSPSSDAVFSNNCPYFVWKDMLGVRRYTVEVSRNPDFPPDETMSCVSKVHPELQWKTPLPPGLWYWRVTSPGIGGKGRRFKQLAQKETDCLPPEIVTRALRITNAADSVTITVKSLGGVLGGVTCMGRKGRCIGKTSNPDEYVFVFSAPHGGWPRGFSEPEVTATDGAGNVARKVLWLLNSPPPVNAVKIGADGYYQENGRRIFPIGIYEVNESEMPKIRKDGFDVVHTYRWEWTQDDKACRAYLDDCWKNDGLRAFIGFDRGKETRNGVIQGNFQHVARRVGALADHPGLFCWYLFDEPMVPGQYVSPDRLTAFADLIRTLDPFHPVVVSTWWETMGEYRKSWDTHWTQAYGYPYGAAQLIHDHRRYLTGFESPITMLLNCNCMDIPWRNGRDVDTAKFSRDYDEFRAAAFLSFIMNCNGLFYWWYAPSNKLYYSASQCPRAWADLTRVIREIGSLRPVFLAEGPSKSGFVKIGRGGVEWWTKDTGGQRYFIAVNTLPEPVEAELDIPSEGRKKIKFKRYETKIVKCKL